MAEVIHLGPGERMPEIDGEEPWLTIEASDDGRFFGTGFGRKSSGESVFYASLAEDDANFERALSAAQEWASRHGVPKIWVQVNP